MGKLCFEAPYLLYSRRTITQPTLASSCSDLTIPSTGVSNVETPGSFSLVIDNKKKIQSISERLRHETETDIPSIKAPDDVCVSTGSPYEVNNSEGSNTILIDQPFTERRTGSPSYSGIAYDVSPEQLHDTPTELKTPSRRTSEQLGNSNKSLKLSLRHAATTESASHSVSFEDDQCPHSLGKLAFKFNVFSVYLFTIFYERLWSDNVFLFYHCLIFAFILAFIFSVIMEFIFSYFPLLHVDESLSLS